MRLFQIHLPNRVIVPTVLFVLLVLSTVVWVVVLPEPYERRILVFPDAVAGSAHVEFRLVPMRPKLEQRVVVLIEELLLGPVQVGAVPFLPEGTIIQSVILGDENVYIDLSAHVLFGAETDTMAFDDSILFLEQNIRLNFPQLGKVLVTVDGNVPGVAPFRIGGRRALTKGIAAL